MSDLVLSIATPTWAALAAACEATGGDRADADETGDDEIGDDRSVLLPGEVLEGEARLGGQALSREEAEALLAAVLDGDVPTPPAGASYTDLAEMAGPSFTGACRVHADRAMQVVRRYADRCGVWEVMQDAGDGTPMARTLAAHPPTEWERLRTLPLEDLFLYFGLRAVSEVSDNLDEYI